MKKTLFTIIILCIISGITIAQKKHETFEWESVQKFKRQSGLPDPFLKPNGTRVNTKNEWADQKQFIKAMLAHYQYGEMPPAPKNARVIETLSEDIYDGTAVRKLYTLTFSRNGKSLDFHFGLIKPKGKGPFPIIIKNDRFINDILDEINIEAIKRGYIMCQYLRSDLSLDDKNLELTRNNGVFPLYPEYDWGTIAAWAWGYQLLIDYFETIDFVDIKKIAVTGHSRGGKTALCGGIFDERIAITAPNSSGLGGTSSHLFYELVGKPQQHIINNFIEFPHWWTSEYYKLAGYESFIPFDAHFNKIAIAPRAFFNTHAYQDYWANPFGAWITCEAAKKVYQWLGAENSIAMHFRTGAHAQNIIDWFALFDFCDKYYFYKPASSKFDVNYDFNEVNPYPWAKIPIDWKVPEN